MEEKDKEVLKEEQPKTEPEKTETVKVNSNVQKIATEENVENKPASSQTKVRLKPKFVPSEDAKQTKNYAWLAYILFFIPLLINSKSAFVRHHANEGLEINIFDLLGTVLLLVGALVETTNNAVNALLLIFVLVGSGLLVLTIITKIYMIVTTLQGKESNTPWMWNLRIIK